MKTKIATALSIVGVLGAGSAAALVNTQILDSGPTDSGASAAVLPPASSITLTVPSAQETIASTTVSGGDPESSSTSVVDATTSDPTVPGSAAPAASGYLTAFNVGDAGVVTVDVIDGRLLLIAAEPAPGWTVTKAEDDSNDDSEEDDDDSDEVEVHFTSSSVRVEFEAHFVDGRIVPEVESASIGGTSTSDTVPSDTVPSNTVPSNTIDDHDDGDDRVGDDHADDGDDDDHADDGDDDDHEDDDRDDD